MITQQCYPLLVVIDTALDWWIIAELAACASGASEWLNFAYIDWKPINGRLLFWLPASVNVSGWLYWADNVWQQKVDRQG